MKTYGTGYYVELRTLDNGDLAIIPTANAIADVERFLAMPTKEALAELFEDWTVNGWEFVDPEKLRALTDAPILTDEIIYGDLGNIERIGQVWWFPNYAVENEVETLLQTGKVVFPRAKEEVA